MHRKSYFSDLPKPRWVAIASGEIGPDDDGLTRGLSSMRLKEGLIALIEFVGLKTHPVLEQV